MELNTNMKVKIFYLGTIDNNLGQKRIFLEYEIEGQPAPIYTVVGVDENDVIISARCYAGIDLHIESDVAEKDIESILTVDKDSFLEHIKLLEQQHIVNGFDLRQRVEIANYN